MFLPVVHTSIVMLVTQSVGTTYDTTRQALVFMTLTHEISVLKMDLIVHLHMVHMIFAHLCMMLEK